MEKDLFIEAANPLSFELSPAPPQVSWDDPLKIMVETIWEAILKRLWSLNFIGPSAGSLSAAKSSITSFSTQLTRGPEHSRNISSDQRKPPIQQYQRLGSRLFKTGGAGLLVESHLFAKKTKTSLLALRSVAGGASGASNLNNSASSVQIAQCFSFFTLGGWKDVN